MLRDKQGLWDHYEFCRFLLEASTNMYFTLQLLIIHPFLFPSSCHLQGMVVTIQSTHRSIQDMEHHLQGIILIWIK